MVAAAAFSGSGSAGGGVARLVGQLLFGRGAGVYDKDIVALRATLNGRCWNDRGVRALAQDQPHVDELVGEKLIALVVENGLELGRAGGGIDLVVDGEQGAGSDLVVVVAIVGFDD